MSDIRLAFAGCRPIRDAGGLEPAPATGSTEQDKTREKLATNQAEEESRMSGNRIVALEGIDRESRLANISARLHGGKIKVRHYPDF
jgi:hypothetical protein